jgi:hypothetical protein
MESGGYDRVGIRHHTPPTSSLKRQRGVYCAGPQQWSRWRLQYHSRSCIGRLLSAACDENIQHVNATRRKVASSIPDQVTGFFDWNEYQESSWVQAVGANRVVRSRGSHIFSRQSAHGWRWGCQPYAPADRPLPPGRFLVLISVIGWVDRRAIKKFNDIVGNRTSDLPACGIVPQPTTLPRGPCYRHSFTLCKRSFILITRVLSPGI